MITITDAAMQHFNSQLSEHNATGIKFGLGKAGCNGFKYEVDFFNNVKGSWVTFEKDKILFAVDTTDISMLKDMEIDFIKEGLNEGLVFRNPYFNSSCGCGESFNV